MKATVFSSSGRGPYSFVCMSTLSLQMDCLTLLYSLQSCSTCWAVSAACPHEQRSVSPTLNIYPTATIPFFSLTEISPLVILRVLRISFVGSPVLFLFHVPQAVVWLPNKCIIISQVWKKKEFINMVWPTSRYCSVTFLITCFLCPLSGSVVIAPV